MKNRAQKRLSGRALLQRTPIAMVGGSALPLQATQYHHSQSERDQPHLGDDSSCASDASGAELMHRHRGGDKDRLGEARCNENVEMDYQIPPRPKKRRCPPYIPFKTPVTPPPPWSQALEDAFYGHKMSSNPDSTLLEPTLGGGFMDGSSWGSKKEPKRKTEPS